MDALGLGCKNWHFFVCNGLPKQGMYQKIPDLSKLVQNLSKRESEVQKLSNLGKAPKQNKPIATKEQETQQKTSNTTRITITARNTN